jgi:hypothetical protein
VWIAVRFTCKLEMEGNTLLKRKVKEIIFSRKQKFKLYFNYLESLFVFGVTLEETGLKK